MKSRYRYITILIILVAVIWIVNDFGIREEIQISKDFEFSFESNTLKQIKDHAKSVLDEYYASEDNDVQIRALINAVECYHYLLYANEINVSRFYDFMRIILLPAQRIKLRKKEEYVYEIKRYLRRKRNLNIQYLKYEVSKPVQLDEQKDEFVQIHLIRTNAENKEYLSYFFKKFKNRFYLYLKSGRSNTNFIFSSK